MVLFDCDYDVNMKNQKKEKVRINIGKVNHQVLLYQKYIHQGQDQHDVSW